jgi:thiamine pyrophosphate-dependent acetolactate synthase large subunit-like protein
MNTQTPKSPYMDRARAVPKLIGNPDDFLIIGGLAGAAKDIGNMTQESPNTFLLGGAMGGASMMAMGLAIAQPDKRVLLVTGDGDLLMSLGSLATIGAIQPSNLAIVCVDNELYGETGDQRAHTSYGIDLQTVAEGCGIKTTRIVKTETEMEEASALLRQSNGPVFVLLKVNGSPPPQYKRNWQASESKTAFRKALLGKR